MNTQLQFRPVLWTLVLVLALTACQTETTGDEETADADAPTEAASVESETIAWDYTGETGPANWATIDEAYEACSGSQQSPIDLVADDEAQDVNVEFDYAEAEGTLVDTGHGVQVNIEGGTLTIDGKAFALKQFHFHTPSEHTVDGNSYPAEVHLVHASDDGELAVLGIFYEEGESNDFLAPVWEGLESRAAMAAADPLMMNAADMLPADRTTYTYPGSLTTPPCSEIVRWHVMQEPLTMSAEQMEALTAIYDDNNRPVQPLNDREIDRVTL
jgi:carbonic anhydrase